MAKAIFTKEFNFDLRPEKGVCIKVAPSDEPQTFPEKLIAAAVDAGVATRFPKKRKSKEEVQD